MITNNNNDFKLYSNNNNNNKPIAGQSGFSSFYLPQATYARGGSSAVEPGSSAAEPGRCWPSRGRHNKWDGSKGDQAQGARWREFIGRAIHWC